MSDLGNRTVTISQNDFVLFGLIQETLNADERSLLIEILINYQNAEIELKDVFRQVAKNHGARWDAFHKLKAFQAKGGTA